MEGNESFRINLSNFLNSKTLCSVNYSELFITNGASNALSMICTIFTKPGDTVFVEDPTYFIIARILKDHKLNIISIPTGSNGMDLDILEHQIKKHKPVFIYTIPVFQNPGTFTVDESNRKRLIEICCNNNSLIIADEVYHLLKYSGSLPFPIVEYDRYGIVLSVNSFSKIFAPGIRLGWIHSKNPNLIKRFIDSGLLFSGGGLNPFTSAIMSKLIEKCLLDDYLNFLIETLSRRMNVLVDALNKYLNKLIEFTPSNGGYYVWAKLKDGLSAYNLEKACIQEKVFILHGGNCSIDGNYDDHIRLCISYHNPDEIEEGVRRVAKAFERII